MDVEDTTLEQMGSRECPGWTPHPPGRFLVPVLVVVALLVGADVARASTALPLLTQVASTIAGKPVDVGCETPEEWSADPLVTSPTTLAYTWFASSTRPVYTRLSPTTCGYLILLTLDPQDRLGSKLNGPDTRQREAQALLTLVHESMHQKLDSRDEGQVECAAITALPDVAKSLGITDSAFLVYATAAHRAKPPAYQTVC